MKAIICVDWDHVPHFVHTDDALNRELIDNPIAPGCDQIHFDQPPGLYEVEVTEKRIDPALGGGLGEPYYIWDCKVLGQLHYQNNV